MSDWLQEELEEWRASEQHAAMRELAQERKDMADEQLPATFDVGTLHDSLGQMVRERPVYVVLDGCRYNVVEIRDRVTNCVELHLEFAEAA